MTGGVNSTELLREALRTAPPGGFRDVDIDQVRLAGRRRRTVRRAAAATTSVVVLLTAAVGAALLLSGSPRPAPATDTTASPEPGPTGHAAWVAWADCLRSADIPGVTVTGPPAGSDDIAYVDDGGNALPGDYRRVNAEWGSATEFCAERVPSLLPQLEARWGDLTSGPARDRAHLTDYYACLSEHSLPPPRNDADLLTAQSAGCVNAPFDVEAEAVLDCGAGSEQSGMTPVLPVGDWVGSPRAAGREWLQLQSDRETFATVVPIPDQKMTSRVHVRSADGRTTAVIYLIVHRDKGWRLQSATSCVPGP